MRHRFVPLALAFYAVLAGIAYAWRRGLHGESPWLAPDPAPGAPLPAALGLGLGAGLALVALSRLITHRTRPGAELARRLAEALPPLASRDVALLALASGVGEELFFRGALQPVVGLVGASVLFGLAHLVPRWPLLLWSAFALGAGFVFGALFQTSGTLVAPALAHVTVNGLNLRWLARRPTPEPRAARPGAGPS
jgi:membrane protease YdiL (CAAX protease family)